MSARIIHAARTRCGTSAPSADRQRMLSCADLVQIGSMMSDNHALLREIGVSCEALDRLVATALGAGALGAKMTGAGRGGNMIALVTDEQTRKNVSETLKEEGGEIIL